MTTSTKIITVVYIIILGLFFTTIAYLIVYSPMKPRATYKYEGYKVINKYKTDYGKFFDLAKDGDTAYNVRVIPSAYIKYKVNDVYKIREQE